MLSPAPPRGQPPPGGSTGAGLGWGSQALPQGAIAPRGMAAPRSLFRAPCWGWGGSRGGGAAPDAAVGSLTGAWGRGGGGLSLVGIYILDHAVAPKFMRSSVTVGGYFRFLPQYFPCAQPIPPGDGGGTVDQPPTPKRCSEEG